MELNNSEHFVNEFMNGTTFKVNNVTIFPHIVTTQETMKLSNISYYYYNDTSYVPELAYINGITNVFSIKEGDIIAVVDPDQITAVFDFSAQLLSTIQEEIKAINKKKVSKLDSNRMSDNRNRKNIESDKKMPPMILNSEKLVIENGKLIIKTNF